MSFRLCIFSALFCFSVQSSSRFSCSLNIYLHMSAIDIDGSSRLVIRRIDLVTSETVFNTVMQLPTVVTLRETYTGRFHAPNYLTTAPFNSWTGGSPNDQQVDLGGISPSPLLKKCMSTLVKCLPDGGRQDGIYPYSIHC
ncbi:hypothetical protein CPB84DRAFT_584096 [Gymnopilus junonius]|uniref:Secreted protein n=1 Tax=Gymnopilus junonius TaxID=109634 RepID=A0A9P5N9G5_GYMJU|nr:hypothetical protein CPB84DRAFT_584096 [Gymnopilus junonius]